MSDFIEITKQYTAQAIDILYPSESIDYSVTLSVLAGGEGGFQPVVITVFSLPGLVINERAVGSLLNQNLHPSYEEVTDTVRKTVETLLARRSEEAQKALGVISSNGDDGRPMGSLIVP